jgi:hypothetical protein
MYASFFKYKDLIPKNNFVDIGYEDLTENPVNTVRGIYDELMINYTSETEEKIKRYLNDINSYTKNTHEKQSLEMEQRIVDEWSSCFKYWNYPIPGEKINS